MLLEKLTIENFGKFANKTEILLGGKIATIIGENGAGKSSILFAIRLLLDKKTRRKGITEEWVPNIDKDIKLHYFFNAQNYKKIGVALPIEEDGTIEIVLSFEFDKELSMYFPIIHIGKIENLKYSHMQKLPFDDYIEIIHIDSLLNNNHNLWIENHFEKTDVFENVKEKIKQANENISKIKEIKQFNEKMKKELKKILQLSNSVAFLEANIQLTKIGKSLNIFHKLELEEKELKRIETHGDGFKKIISILSMLGEGDKNKLWIVIIDELENNFFYSYQVKVMNYFEELLLREKINVSQVIVTTHSPNIVKIANNSSITKLRNNDKPNHFIFNEQKYFDYYQKELSIAIFYEKILMVEGHSEKMFFEYLFKKNKYFKKHNWSSEIFILNNQGIHFSKVFNFLKTITKKVIVLTDNDKWNNTCHGLERIWKLSCEINKNLDENKYNFNCKNTDSNKIKEEIIAIGEKNAIFTQKTIGSSFEDALLNEGLIDKEKKEKLKNGKLKNLVEFMENISSKINEQKIQNSNYLFKWIKNIE